MPLEDRAQPAEAAAEASVPADDLAGAGAATREVLALVDRLAGRPGALQAHSLLPGWSRAHVVAHLAGNARSHTRMLRGTEQDVVADQYPTGAEGRADEIDRLAADPPAAVAALHEACDELEATWRRLGPQQWHRSVRRLDEGAVPAVDLAWARWREVVVHGADLDAGYGPGDWAPGVVERVLADRGDRLGGHGVVLVDGGGRRHVLGAEPCTEVRGTLDDLVMWALGRGDGRRLSPAGGSLPHLPEWR